MPLPDETHMLRETMEAACAVERSLLANAVPLEGLARKIKEFEPRFVVTCARGSSDHAATFAKYVIERTLGLTVSSFAPSIVSIYQAPVDLRGALYLTISQSGGSPDIVEAAKYAREAGAFTVAFVNVENSPLAEVCQYVVPLQAGPESSVAATKSYILSLVALLDLVERFAGIPELRAALQQLPETLEHNSLENVSTAVDVLRHVRSLFVVGRGPGLGIAAEAALKFKETCGIHAEAFSAAEVRHGPMAIVGDDFPVLLFSSSSEPDGGVLTVGSDFISRGTKVMTFGPQLHGALCVSAPSCGHSFVTYISEIHAFYRLVNAVSLARGHNPDAPPHLNKITRTL